MEKVKDYLKIADAAEFLGVSQNTLRSWAEAGKIACRRNPANKYRLFRKQDLEKYLQSLEADYQKQQRKKSPK